MKIAQGIRPCGAVIPHFDQISVKISVLELPNPNRCTEWGLKCN